MKSSSHPFKSQVDVIASAIAILLIITTVAQAQLPASVADPDNAAVKTAGDGVESGFPSVGAEAAGKESKTGGAGDQLLGALEMLNLLLEGEIEQEEFTDIEEIARLQRELMRLDLEHRKAVLTSKIKLLRNDGNSETDSKIDELRSELELLKGRLGSLNPVAEGGVVQSTKPVVLEITGNSTSMEAVLHLPGIGPVTARNGSVLPNGMKVESVELEGVRVQHGRKSTLLTIGPGYAIQSGSRSALPSTGMPSDSLPSNRSSGSSRQ